MRILQIVSSKSKDLGSALILVPVHFALTHRCAGKGLFSREQSTRDTTEALMFVGSFRPHVSASMKSWCLRCLLNVSEVEEVQMSADRALQRLGSGTPTASSPNVWKPQSLRQNSTMVVQTPSYKVIKMRVDIQGFFFCHPDN